MVAAEGGEEEADKELGNRVGKRHPELGCTRGKGGFSLQGFCCHPCSREVLGLSTGTFGTAQEPHGHPEVLGLGCHVCLSRGFCLCQGWVQAALLKPRCCCQHRQSQNRAAEDLEREQRLPSPFPASLLSFFPSVDREISAPPKQPE